MTVLRNRLFLKDGGLPDSEKTPILVLQRPEQFIKENTVSGDSPMMRLKETFPASEFRLMPAEKCEKELARNPVRTEEYARILAVKHHRRPHSSGSGGPSEA